MKLTKMSILAGALMILLIGCPGVSDSSPDVNDSSGGDSLAIPTMADGENVATDQAVNFITSLEDVDGGLDGLSDGQSVTIDGVSGTVTVKASTPTGTMALVGTDTEPNKTITFTFPDGGKFDGESVIKLFDDGMSIDGEVNFDVTDVDGEPHDIPVLYEEATLNANGEVISGAIQVGKDGEKIEIDASVFNTLKKFATFIRKIDEKMIAIQNDGTGGDVFIVPDMTSMVYEQSYTATPRDVNKEKEVYGPYNYNARENARTELEDISTRFVKIGGSELQSWSYKSYVEMPLKTKNQSDGSDGFIMDITQSIDMRCEYSYVSQDNEDKMSMKFKDTFIMDGTVALGDTTVVFDEVTTHQSLEEIVSLKFLQPQPKNEWYRFTGSITIDGVTIKLNNGAMEALASLQGGAIRGNGSEDVQ